MVFKIKIPRVLWMGKKERRIMKCRVVVFLALTMFMGCAGMQRGCSSFWATQAGADWIVVQYNAGGDPINCWKLQSVSITNEANSDGVYWREGSGHLIHISGWYNRVQVSDGRYEEAAKLLGVELSRITNGKYKEVE